MIRFVSGFILGYITAKHPPTPESMSMFTADIQRMLSDFGIRFTRD
jgi:hypothetical protein